MVLCGGDFVWIGDALRESVAHLTDKAIPGDIFLFTSSELSSPRALSPGLLMSALTGCELVYRDHMVSEFGEAPADFGVFDDVAAKSAIVFDPLFTKFWANLNPGMTGKKDRLFAQMYFHDTFAPHYAVKKLFAVDEAAYGEGVTAITSNARARNGKAKNPVSHPKAGAHSAHRSRAAHAAR